MLFILFIKQINFICLSEASKDILKFIYISNIFVVLYFKYIKKKKKKHLTLINNIFKCEICKLE